MNYTDKEIELFIEQRLQTHTDILVRIFRGALEKNKNIDSGTLLNSVQRVSIGRNPDGSISASIELARYGRFMEIRGCRLRRNRNHEVWESKNHRLKQKKTAWYNKNKFKGYGTLQRELVAGISEHELQEIRNIIAQSGLNQ